MHSGVLRKMASARIIILRKTETLSGNLSYPKRSHTILRILGSLAEAFILRLDYLASQIGSRFRGWS